MSSSLKESLFLFLEHFQGRGRLSQYNHIGRAGAEAEAPILWTPDAKRRLIGKDHDAGKD